MTRQYLVGELSLILGELEAAPMDEPALRDVARLRKEVERMPPAILAPLVARAVELTDGLCWLSLARGETEAFIRELAICAELGEFGVCAGFLEEGRTTSETGRL